MNGPGSPKLAQTCQVSGRRRRHLPVLRKAVVEPQDLKNKRKLHAFEVYAQRRKAVWSPFNMDIVYMGILQRGRDAQNGRG
jgi:hypothetical protein